MGYFWIIFKIIKNKRFRKSQKKDETDEKIRKIIYRYGRVLME